jgi:hypothetical protein
MEKSKSDYILYQKRVKDHKRRQEQSERTRTRIQVHRMLLSLSAARISKYRAQLRCGKFGGIWRTLLTLLRGMIVPCNLSIQCHVQIESKSQSFERPDMREKGTIARDIADAIYWQ